MDSSFGIKPDKSCVRYAGYYFTDILKQHLPNLKAKELKTIRDVIIENVFQGIRSKYISEKLVKLFNLEKKLADRLATHSFSYLMAKYHQARFTKNGISYYKWSQSHKGCHDRLSGKTYKFDAPPITENGECANPGELLGCTCVAIARIDTI